MGYSMQGKLSTSELNDLVLSNITIKNSDVVLGSAIGEDCAAIDFGDELMVLTMDPITATAESLGKLLVRINANDIATTGAMPRYMMITLLMPTTSNTEDLKIIMKDVKNEIDKLGIDLIGGHTEFTSAVNSPTACAVMLAKKPKRDFTSLKKIEKGDYIFMTGSAGIEGTGIIAMEKSFELEQKFGLDFVKRAKEYIEKTLVVDAGISASKVGVKAMHDVTEGGVLGSIWEMISGAGLGCKINKSKIFVDEETKIICEHYGIDPFRLIGSGSLIIIVSKDRCKELEKALESSSTKFSIIGCVTDEKLLIDDGLSVSEIKEPYSDELYKVV